MAIKGFEKKDPMAGLNQLMQMMNQMDAMGERRERRISNKTSALGVQLASANTSEEISNLTEIGKLQKRVKELENSLSIALETNNRYQKDMALFREDAQVEIMRRDERIKEAGIINKLHQELNGKLQVELARYRDGHDL